MTGAAGKGEGRRGMMVTTCPNCGGTHYGSLKCPYTKAPCVICGGMTILACSDCAIDSGGKDSVHVCERPECRDKHEAEKHPLAPAMTTPTPSAARALCDNFTKLEAAIKEQKARATGAETLYEAVREWENLDSLRREAVPALISHVRALADEVKRQADQLRKMDEAFLTLNDEAGSLKARAELAEAERDALLGVARAAYGTTGDAAFAALPAALAEQEAKGDE